MNNIILIGRLVADPETRYTQSGIAVCNFCVAVDRKYKNAAGERETDFINCVAWRKTGEVIGQYLTKGREIGVQGSLHSRKYQDKDGNNRTAYEVQVDSFDFIGSRGAGVGQGMQPPPPGPSQRAVSAGPGPASEPFPEPPPDNPMDDDLPF
jgi:single-strand DNA-binding protein